MTISKRTRRLIAGNWKMNLSTQDASNLVKSLLEGLSDDVDSKKFTTQWTDILVAPPSTLLRVVEPIIQETPIKLGAQNVHYARNGAYTGELSLEMIKECGCSWVILGHSERRQYFSETDELVNRKTMAALALDVNPIICVGESLEEKKSEWTEQKVALQVRAALSGVSECDARRVTIAYEPIWAIGTGETATPEEAQNVHKMIRSLLADIFNEEIADDIRILYGGSAKPSNAAELLSESDIDGLLVGGASLKADLFLQMIQISEELALRHG